MSLSRRVGRNTIVQLGGRLYTSLMAFVVTALVLPRYLSTDEFGIVSFYLILFLLLVNVLDFGAATIVVREASRDRAAAGRLIGALISIKARFALIGVLVVAGMAVWFEGLTPRMGLMVLASLHLLCHAPAAAVAIFAVDMAFRWQVLAQSLGQTAWVASTLALLAWGTHEPAAYVLSFAFGGAVYAGVAWGLARRHVVVRFDSTRQERAWLWSESWPAGVAATMASIYFYVDTVMLRPLLGETAVAHYAAAYRIMTFVLMVPVLVSQVLFPIYARLWERGPERLAPVVARATRLLFSIGIVFAVCLPAVRLDIMTLVYPEGYESGAAALGILALATVCVFCAYPHVLLVLAAGHQRVMMVVSTLGVVLNVVLNLWWVPRAGIEGAAWATVVTEGFIVLAAAGCGRALTGILVPARELLRGLLCAAIAGGVLALVLPRMDAVGPAWRVAVGVVVGVVAVLASGVLPLDLATDEGGPEPAP